MGRIWLKTLFPILLFTVSFDHCNAEESGTIIPLYIYPRTDSGGNAWQQLFDAYRAHPINTWAIVNVNSGPGGSQQDSNYVEAINQLHSAGIKTLGYVRTDYGRNDQAQVRSEIDQWKQLYRPHGIFFDEMAYEDDNQKVQYYQDLGNYAKQNGFTFTVGNPGTRTVARYFNTMDNIVIFETNTGLPSSDLICSQDTNGHGRNAVSVLAYNIANLDAGSVANLKGCAAYIFVTDDNGNNPWDTLPNYLPRLFQVLQG